MEFSYFFSNPLFVFLDETTDPQAARARDLQLQAAVVT
jgi:hypothetical protein